MLVRLREIERADLPVINRWRNDPEVVACLGANYAFVGREVDERWFEAYLSSRDRAVRLAITLEGADAPIGCVYLLDIHRINRSAEFAIMIGEKAHWSNGYGTHATKAALAHAFDDLNLNRVYLTVLADNPRAIRVYAKAGFRVEGRQREAVYKKCRYCDVISMAIIRTQYYSEQSESI